MARLKSRDGELSISVTDFRTHCHALLRRIERRSLRRIVLTMRGKEVAVLVAFPPPRLRGALKGTVFIPPGVDITEPTGEIWDAGLDKEGIL
jgi:antitoxin (DNA-binding transcriptional repressor) of toxin-antitoxin stability system